MQTTYGALPSEWDQLSLILGVTRDLLPVVSNPEAVISPESNMSSLGKTPSRYNQKRQVSGFAGWTSHEATQAEVDRWRKQPDYGICLQSREVRAIDIDVDDLDTVAAIGEAVYHQTGIKLPYRTRPNSSKCLLVFRLLGELPKRVIKLDKGIIELLGTGQQFIAAGTHPSGVKYEWAGGLPDEIPELTLEQVDKLWSHLAQTFGTSDTVSTSPSKAKVLNSAISNDLTATYLLTNGWVKSTERDGRLHITCPFEEGHSTGSTISATTYFPANTGGYQRGHFDCRHASCEHRTDDQFKAQIGIPVDDPFDDFDVVPTSASPSPKPGTQEPDQKAARFQVIPAEEFAQVKPSSWIVKGVLPQAELGVLFGESGSGKSFWVLDLLGAIAQGKEWRGHRVKKGTAVYIAAEGSGGMRSRLRAYSMHHGVELDTLGLGIIPDAPNFMQAVDVKAVLAAVRAFGTPSVIVVDTFAQVMAGANENAGEDVGQALAHCRQLHKHTGALVLLVHHAGKDASKGARGWSGLRAAADVEIEVSRCDDDRVATITKLKDGIDGTEFGFKLLPAPTGWDDEDGEAVHSCVVEYTDAKRAVRGPKEKAIGRNEKLALACLNDLLGLGEDKVASEELIGRVISGMVPPEAGKRDRRRDSALQAVEGLRERGQIEIANAFVSLSVGGANE